MYALRLVSHHVSFLARKAPYMFITSDSDILMTYDVSHILLTPTNSRTLTLAPLILRKNAIKRTCIWFDSA